MKSSHEIIDRFVRIVFERSGENQSSSELLLKEAKYGVAIGLLRQEIDTFVRVTYLNEVSKAEAIRLINEFDNGHQWTYIDSKRRITDRDMVNIAKQYYFWIEKAYEFGCKLIHLSEFYDYKHKDPFLSISLGDKKEIIKYLDSYHGYRDDDIDLNRFILYFPKVMRKIEGKIKYYTRDLQKKLTT